MKKTRPLLKSARLAVLVFLGLVIFAYGFQVTQVSFEEIHSTRRQESLVRVVRAIFHPDIIEYDKVQTPVNVAIYVPCPSQPVEPAAPDQSGAYLVVTPACAAPRAEVQVEGFNFPINYRGQLYFIPPSEVSLGLSSFDTDENGYFKVNAKLPPRPSDQVQYIRAITVKNVGNPRLSRTATDTWNKIIETVFLALLATAFGIIFAVPISFFAARNLMKDITTTISSLSLSVLGWPVGMWLGATLAGWVGEQADQFFTTPLLTLAGFIISCVLIWLITRWALPQEEERKPGPGLRLARTVMLLLAAVLSILVLFLIASLMLNIGDSMSKSIGFVGMMSNFVKNLGEILQLLIAVIAAVAGGAVFSNFLSRLAMPLIRPLTGTTRLIVNMIFGILAGAAMGLMIGAALDWIYQINNPVQTAWIPAGIGAGLGCLAVYRTRKQDALPIGLTIYYITRTVLNGLRAIEALIWVIIFVVWVGIGPFAGVLALALHTIAALAKLYSEQVESILPGPMEAIKATGATRLQVIVYSVIPQITPLYISFTMYRWDINVRMSTIIGFAGGGGIGFLLLQNINLLNYRAASTQMLAIAVVVAAMDYLSSYMRERVV
jgi:phosphonate ABC transporter permease subunit PhnE